MSECATTPAGRAARIAMTIESAALAAAAVEIAMIIAASLATGVAYHWSRSGVLGNLSDFAVVGVLAGVLYALVLRGHTPAAFLGAASTSSVAGILTAWAAAFAVIAALGFASKAGVGFSRGAVISFFFVGGVAVVGFRRLARAALRQMVARGALRGPRVVLLLEPDQASDGQLMADLARFGYAIDSAFPVTGDTIADIAALTAFVRTRKIDQILVLMSWSQPERIEDVLSALRVLPTPVSLVTDSRLRGLLSRRVDTIGETLSVELRRPPLSRVERAAKRLLDVTLAGAAVVALAPLLATIAVLIRLEGPGPVLFRQRRGGFNGQNFRIFKFRSMSVLENGPEIAQARREDPRVTAVGRWLRRTSLDELPQLFNVLAGEMSLVGPRPHAEAHDLAFNDAVADYALRHHVKPGITGWAQVQGCRGETPDAEAVRRRVEHDIWFIDNWSLKLELVILIRTAGAVVRGLNAH